MAKIFVVSMLVALSHASSSGYYGTVGVYPALPAIQRQVHEQTHLGQPIHRTTAEVVGHRTVHVGTQAYQAGHQYVHAGTDVQKAPSYSYQADAPKTTSNTVPLPAPALPAAPAPYAAIPPAPVNLGPAPADTVTQIKVPKATRKHTVITPVQTRVEPQLQKIPQPYDVPVAVPRPVERIQTVDRHVARPYPVEVPQPYAVPQPYVVNPVHHVVEQPIINKHTYSVEQPIVQEHIHSHTQSHAHHQVAAVPVQAYAHQQAYGHQFQVLPVQGQQIVGVQGVGLRQQVVY